MCADEEMASQCMELERYSALQADSEIALALSGFDDDDDVVVVTPTPVRPAARKRASKLVNAGVGTTCNICLEDMVVGDKRSVLKCKHVYHHKCLAEWTKKSKTCPIDRLEFRKVTVVKGSE